MSLRRTNRARFLVREEDYRFLGQSCLLATPSSSSSSFLFMFLVTAMVISVVMASETLRVKVHVDGGVVDGGKEEEKSIR